MEAFLLDPPYPTWTFFLRRGAGAGLGIEGCFGGIVWGERGRSEDARVDYRFLSLPKKSVH